MLEELKKYENDLRNYLDNYILRVERVRPITLQELSWQEDFVQNQLLFHKYSIEHPLEY